MGNFWVKKMEDLIGLSLLIVICGNALFLALLFCPRFVDWLGRP
jgi:hypothetical protein